MTDGCAQPIIAESRLPTIQWGGRKYEMGWACCHGGGGGAWWLLAAEVEAVALELVGGSVR